MIERRRCTRLRPNHWPPGALALALLLSIGSLASVVRGASPEEEVAARARIRRTFAAMRARERMPDPAKPGLHVPADPVRRATGLPLVLVSVEPARPVAAELAGDVGRLVIECVIDEQGLVRDCVVLESWPALEASALAALAQWRFRPVLIDGKARSVFVAWTWKHGPDDGARDWRPHWKFRWDRATLAYEW